MNTAKFLVVDVETANSTDDALVYDLGYAVTDRFGNIYEAASLTISDIFYGERELMQSAYYAKKIPLYLEAIKSKKTEVVTFKTAYIRIRQIMKKYAIKVVAAYNASFDTRALNTTLRFLSSSQKRYFFPYGTEVYCIWHMACQVLYTQKSFQKMAIANNWISEKGNLKTSAEVGFRYMSKDSSFEEEHTGLADVMIEIQIMARCFRQKKKMVKTVNRFCWRIPTKVMKTA